MDNTKTSDWPHGYGLCCCGCGERTPPHPRTCTRQRQKKGEPKRWLNISHSRRRDPGPPVVTDCGYVTPCHVWQGYTVNGYGMMLLAPGINRVGAHRAIYERLHGPVHPDAELDHLCRNRACVNPDHLEPVTHAENSRRGLATKLTAEQVLAIRADPRFQWEIADEYGVCRSTVSHIKTGRNWTADMG